MFIFISLFSFSIAQFEIRWKSVWNVGDRIPVFFSTISLDTGRRAAAGQNQISTQQSTHRANGSLHWYDPAITALKPPQSCLFRCPNCWCPAACRHELAMRTGFHRQRAGVLYTR
jgi:hypothetical protein